MKTSLMHASLATIILACNRKDSEQILRKMLRSETGSGGMWWPGR